MYNRCILGYLSLQNILIVPVKRLQQLYPDPAEFIFFLFFIYLKLELLTEFPASNDEKYLSL